MTLLFLWGMYECPARPYGGIRMEWTWFHAVVIGGALIAALTLFARAIVHRYRLLSALGPAPDATAGDSKERLHELLVTFLGQKKLFQDIAPGVMHALIFWGFLILLLRGSTLFGMAFFGFDFHLPLLGTDGIIGRFYSLFKDIANVTVAIMVLYALHRRYLIRVPRLLNTGGALFVLVMILTLMVSDMIFDGVLHASARASFEWFAPVGSGLGVLFASGGGALPTEITIAGQFGFFVHLLGILTFLVYIPSGKHMHIFSSIFNVGLKPLNRSGRLLKLDLEDESIESFGVTKIEDYSWKDGLDLVTCTECGRCNDACPAQRTGKKLAPREITLSQKHNLLDDEAPRLLASPRSPEPVKPMVPDVVTAEEIWACTTCQACEQACPVNIHYVQRINSMRRSEVLNSGRFPVELKRVFKGMETNSNPWGIGVSNRMKWAEGLDVPLFADGENTEYLLYLGCAASFDDRAQKLSRLLVEFLLRHQVSFGILGTDEGCCGETARRLGEEALGQTMIQTNVELFKELGVRKILTLCPHCFNTFRNEYSDFGASLEVIHHSQLIARMIDSRQASLQAGVRGRVAIHDSCYLARVNQETEAPRRILHTSDQVTLVEPREHGLQGLCCGAGGGMFWLEEHGKRINHERFDQLMLTSPDIIATCCPYCLAMLGDAAKDNAQAGVRVSDLIELVE